MPARLLSLLALLLLLAAAPQREPAAFLPSKHGFRFTNTFRGTPLPPSLRGLGIEKQMRIADHYGLCGGMSLSAADYYLSGKPVPAAASPPKEGEPLYAYIYQRQTDSMGTLGIMATKFIRWMQLPDASAGDEESCASLTATELPAILTRQEQGELVPLELVYAKAGAHGRDKLWENHQVLAFRSDATADGGHDIHVYDPNFPGDDAVVIKLAPVFNPPASAQHAPRPQVTCEQTTGKGRILKVRGLFAMPYTRRTPA